MTQDELKQLEHCLEKALPDKETGETVCTERERSFLDNLNRNYRKRPVTKPQEDWLLAIWKRLAD